MFIRGTVTSAAPQRKDLKESIMKKQMMTTMAAAVFFATLSIASVHAQNAGTVSVSIPFEFSAANKTLPAGDYYVRRSIQGAKVDMEIISKDRSQTVLLTIHPVHGIDRQTQSKLVFNRYGDQYFLSQLWIAGRSNGEESAKTSRERSLRSEMAARAIKSESVTIAGKAN
jgi:hypothetical protein